jgi:isocitrate dehydrogenase
VRYATDAPLHLPRYERRAPGRKELQGVDLFVHWGGRDAADLARLLEPVRTTTVGLSMITNRGIKVYPDGFPETFCTDHWRCRFKPKADAQMSKADIVRLLTAAETEGIDVIKTENLYAFDGKPAFSLGQGQ